jgi:hypothetical protein
MSTGLAPTALIGYWELTADPRVPPVVKRILDFAWGQYDAKEHVIAYNADPVGPKCAKVCLWFQSFVSGTCYPEHNGQVLQNLLAYNYAWYWSITGDDTYRRRGDDLFAHALDHEPLSGKEWSQNYYSSFQFVELRRGGAGAASQPARGPRRP